MHLKTNHQSAGMVLSKHLETMQRANEQLVKLTALFKKTESNAFTGFSDSERDTLFEEIKKEQKNQHLLDEKVNLVASQVVEK